LTGFGFLFSMRVMSTAPSKQARETRRWTLTVSRLNGK
jgi:hypothetical protein